MKEKEFIPFLWKWLEYKNEFEVINVPRSTKNSNKWKVGAIVKRLETDNDLDFKTLKRVAEGERRYSYGHRMARMLKAAILWAHGEGFFEKLPKLSIRMPEPTFDHCIVHLTEDQIEALMDLPLEGKLLEARRLWFFQRRTGLAYCDMKNFVQRVRKVNSKRRRWALISRQKTKNTAYLELDGWLIQEIEWLKDVKIPCLQTYNERLHEVEKIAGIVIRTQTGNTKTLTSHVGRKQFAQETCDSGTDDEILKLRMGVVDDRSLNSYRDKNIAFLDAKLDQNSTISQRYEPNQYRLFA